MWPGAENDAHMLIEAVPAASAPGRLIGGCGFCVGGFRHETPTRNPSLWCRKLHACATGKRCVRRTVSVIVFAALSSLVAITALWVFQRRLIYFPSRDLPMLQVVLPGAESVTFETRDGLTLSGWFVPGDVDGDGVTVVIFNGNGGNRGGRVPLAKALADRGYGVLLFDYRGYGDNPGTPSEDGLSTDGLAAVTYLGTRTDVNTGRLVYFGESLGAAIAIGVAEDRPPAVLVLRSPFTSLADVASVHYPFLPVSVLLKDRYENLKAIDLVGAPLLVIAGSADRTVPVDQSVRVYDAASGHKALLIIDGADHNDQDLSAGFELVDEIEQFIDQVLLRGPG